METHHPAINIESLMALSNNLWWCWQKEGGELWSTLSECFTGSSDLWHSLRHNPKALLKELIHQAGGLEVFTQQLSPITTQIQTLQHSFENYLSASTKMPSSWAPHRTPYRQEGSPNTLEAQNCPLTAYFCAEFGLHESLAIYSGGLGILAGDHVKSASDLNLPFIGVGLLYRNGYVQQRLNAQGEQEALFLTYDFDDYPLTPALTATGERIIVEIPILGRSCAVQAWRLAVGRVQIILLDTDLEQNDSEQRAITAKLYGGDGVTRIQQELVLGIAGTRVLRALDIHPEVFHLNEGHSSFLNFERLRELIQQGLSYADALSQIKASSVFTTHTPVEAGHDRFDATLAARALEWLSEPLSLNLEAILALGRWPDEQDPDALFNMTLLAMNTCHHLNGVAALHGEVSREMFCRFWNCAPQEAPITSVTNGVHGPTWQEQGVRAYIHDALGGEGPERVLGDEAWIKLSEASDEALWQARRAARVRLLDLAENREQARRQRLGLPAWESKLDPDALTIGFARRFATYKRANLIFSELERLTEILNAAPGPVQLLFSGKAHPADEGGKALVKAVYEASLHPKLQGRVLLIEDYDIEVGRAMVQGSDVWLNNPRRPKEASGTSGMKVAMSGGLNLSILDGWWPEGFNGKNGWAIGEAKRYHDPDLQDREDAMSLYETLAQEVIPTFFERDQFGLPRRWLSMSKESILTCTPQFHSDRQVRDYVTQLYSQAVQLR